MDYLDDWLTTESTLFPDRNVATGSHQRKLTTTASPPEHMA